MNQDPARIITNVRSKKNTGFFPSLKNARPIAFESLLERDYLYLIEFDKNVLSYGEQPFTIEYMFNNKKYKYTPDFLVVRPEKTQVVEVKPKKKLDQAIKDPKLKAKFVMAHRYSLTNGYEFVTVTDEDIHSGCKLENIKKLFAFSRFSVPAKEKMKIKNFVVESGPIEIGLVAEKIMEDQVDFNRYCSYIFSLLYSNYLHCNIYEPIDSASKIWLCQL